MCAPYQVTSLESDASSSSRLENLINVLPAVLVGRLQIMKFLIQIRHFGSELSGLYFKAILDFVYWCVHEPINYGLACWTPRKSCAAIPTSFLHLRKHWSHLKAASLP